MANNKKTNTTPATTARGQRAPKGVLRRLLKTLFEFYPVLLPVALICILINAIVSSVPAVFMQRIIALVDESYLAGDWASVSGRILTYVGILVAMYILEPIVVDAVAGIHNYPLPQIIIDMGTATTVSVIDREGNYRGGMILPGVVVSSDSLISRTAQLQKVAFEVPKNLIGRNTIDCMKSGILYGNAGALDGLIDRINAELDEPCTVIATGGLAGVITPLCRNKILLDDDLLLKGLLLLYNKNTPTD